jgi:hypothetical protein
VRSYSVIVSVKLRWVNRSRQAVSVPGLPQPGARLPLLRPRPIYCSGNCSRRARRQSQRAAAQRYQATLPGRRTHAARMDRYRARQEIVAHQGSPPPPADDLLPGGAMATTSEEAFPRLSEPSDRLHTAIGAVVPACRSFARSSCADVIIVAAVSNTPGRSANPHGDANGTHWYCLDRNGLASFCFG